MAGNRQRTALGQHPVAAEIAGEFRSGDAGIVFALDQVALPVAKPLPGQAARGSTPCLSACRAGPGLAGGVCAACGPDAANR